MSRHNRERRKNTPSQRKERGQEATYRYTEPPPAPFETDLSKFRICPDPAPTPPPPESPDNGTTEHQNGSRFNAIRDSLRSRILFPDHVLQAINERARGYTGQAGSSGPLEDFLFWEMARGSIQSELCQEKIVLNSALAAERAAGPRWVVDRTEQACRLGQKLSASPCRVKGALERTKYGALYLIEKLTSLAESVATNGCLDVQQISVLFDLTGVDPVFRNGSKKVPAASDGPALSAVIATQIALHRGNLQRSLETLDANERTAAELGIVRQYDQESLKLRSDLARADRRFKWAWESLCLIRQGVDPATIIDPETKKPVAPGPRPAAAPKRARSAPPPSASPSPPPSTPLQAAEDSPPPAAPRDLPPFPEHFSEDDRESLLIAVEMLGQLRDGARAATPETWESPPA